MIRAVIDTSFLVRAIIKPSGSVGPVLQRLRQREYVLLASRPTLDELIDVLARPRLRLKYGLSEDVVRAAIRLILFRCELVQPNRRIAVCRDPDDNKFLEVAMCGHAQAIVSGDADLLSLDSFEGIAIETPVRFLMRLDGAR